MLPSQRGADTVCINSCTKNGKAEFPDVNVEVGCNNSNGIMQVRQKVSHQIRRGPEQQVHQEQHPYNKVDGLRNLKSGHIKREQSKVAVYEQHTQTQPILIDEDVLKKQGKPTIEEQGFAEQNEQNMQPQPILIKVGLIRASGEKQSLRRISSTGIEKEQIVVLAADQKHGKLDVDEERFA